MNNALTSWHLADELLYRVASNVPPFSVRIHLHTWLLSLMTVRLLHVPFCELHRRSVAPNVAYRPRKNVQIKVPALLAGGSLSKEARILETEVEKTDIE